MSTTLVPEATWAQRSSTSDPEKNYVYLTISVPDVPKDKLKLDLKSTSLSFTGTSDTKKSTYHVDMEFYGEIDPEESKINHTAANTQMILRKKELKEEFWPRLLKDSKKVHYLRTDFDKWVDEDEQDEAPEDDMNQFGGMGGMPGMGGMGGGDDGGFGGIDFSQLGGAGGMPGMEGLSGLGNMGGMGGMGGAGEDEDEDDDEDGMPELEEEDASKTPAAPTKSSKIEEVE